MSYATGSTVKLVRTNSLTSVKDLIKTFAPEKQQKVTVHAGMRKYLSTTVLNVTKAVGEVTGVGHGNTIPKKKFVLAKTKFTENSTPVPLITAPPAPSSSSSSSSATLDSSVGPSLDCSTSTGGTEDVFHNMSSEADKTKMDESKDTQKRPHSTSPEALARPVLVSKKKKGGVSRSASNSPYGSDDDAVDNKLLYEKVKKLEEEICKLKMTSIKNASSINTNIEAIESANQSIIGMQNDMTEIKEGMTGIKESLVETMQVNQITSDKMDQLAAELNIKLDRELNKLSCRISENEKVALDTKNTLEIVEKALREQRAGENLIGPSRSSMGIYLVGIEALRQQICDRSDEDPIAVVKKMLYQANCFYFYDRIILGDKQKNRLDTRTALIYFRSMQNKKEAEVGIKRFLASLKAKGVMIRDIFPSERMKEVGGLNKCGFDMKNEGKISRFRIQNRRDVPILQGIYPGGSSYVDIHPDEYSDALEIAMELDRQESSSRQQHAEENENRMEQTTTNFGDQHKQQQQLQTLHTTVPNNSYGTGQGTGNKTTAATQGALLKNGASGATAGSSTGAGGSGTNRGGGGGVGPTGGRMTRGGGGGVGPRGGNSGHDRGHNRGGAWSNGGYGGSYTDNRRVLIQNRFEQLGNNSDSDGNTHENFPPYNPNDIWYTTKNKGSGKNPNYRKQKSGYM